DRRRRRTRAERGEDDVAESYEERDAGWVIEISRGEMPRPFPIVGLVRECGHERGEDHPQHTRRRNDQQRKAPALIARRRVELAHAAAVRRERYPRTPRTTNTMTQVQRSHITRSSGESVVSMRQATTGAAKTSAIGFVPFA